MSPSERSAPGLRFASRIDVDLAPNALAAASAARRAAGGRILDLTASNPTRAGFAYPEAGILAAIASPAALRYEPDPVASRRRGRRSALTTPRAANPSTRRTCC